MSSLLKLIGNRLGHLRLGMRGYFPYFGANVYAPPGNLLYGRLRQEGVFEREVSHYLVKSVKPDTWFFDVGANLGLMSLPVLAQCRNVKVLSIEPSPNSYPHLERTRNHSPYQSRWETLCKAATNKTGTVPFALADPTQAAFEGMRHTGRMPTTKTVEVEATTLDEIWQSRGKPDVSLIKIDVEGAETEVLEGAALLLRTCRPVVALEWNPLNLRAYGTPVGRLLDLANTADYFCCEMDTLVPINHLEHLEHLTTQGRENFVLYPKHG